MSNIIRILKPEKYAILSHEMLRDSRLSFAARGLLAYFLSLPDNWEIRISHILKQSPAGRDALKTIFKDLIKHGYLRRRRLQDKQGKIYYETLVFESPENPPADSEEIPENEDISADSPSTENPSTVGPSTEKPPLRSNNLKKEVREEITIKENKEVGSRASRSPGTKKMNDEEFISYCKAEPAYAHINIDWEAGKMRKWCAERGKQPTRRRFINWLNNVELPMGANGNGSNGRHVQETSKANNGGTRAQSERDRRLDALRAQAERVQFVATPSTLDGEVDAGAGRPAGSY